MLSERFSDNDFTRLVQEAREFDKRLDTAAEIAHEIEDRLAQIDQALIMNECMAGGALNWITMKAQRSQLEALSGFVLNAYEDGTSITINLDSPQLLTAIELPSEDFYHEFNEQAQEAFEYGEKRGTDVFSEIITPTVFDDPQMRTMYYSPWSRELFKARFHPEELSDGSIWQPLGTRIPEAEVVFYYGPGSKQPERLFHLPATRPSLPQ